MSQGMLMVGAEYLIVHQIKHLEANHCTSIIVVLKETHKEVIEIIKNNYKGIRSARKCQHIV